MVGKNRGIYAFLGPSWVLITMVPSKIGDPSFYLFYLVLKFALNFSRTGRSYHSVRKLKDRLGIHKSTKRPYISGQSAATAAALL